MKASELRINNWIKDGNDFEQITIDHLSCLNSGRCEFDPIPLTEEWLLKFGFECLDSRRYQKKYRRNYSIDGFMTSESFMVGLGSALTKLEYVHQLQNLYFALTGEELVVKK